MRIRLIPRRMRIPVEGSWGVSFFTFVSLWGRAREEWIGTGWGKDGAEGTFVLVISRTRSNTKNQLRGSLFRLVALMECTTSEESPSCSAK